MMRRALVVDDDRSMVRTLSDILEMNGWEVRPAYSGTTAVQAAVAEPFDVVLMDVKMPGLDGVDAFKAMKRARPHIRVVLMTAYAAPDRLSEAQREGAISVMSKPVNIVELFQILAEKLDSDCPVLVIDQDAIFLKTLSEVLRLKGYDVETAENLAHATRLITERHPKAVLLHLNAGADDVRNAVSTVHHANPQTAIILYSGNPRTRDALERVIPDNWVHAYLEKPFTIEQVTTVLDRLPHGD